MNKKIKAMWLKALRSGKYKQGKFKLASIDKATKKTSFCCLGVLCDLHAKTLKIKNAWRMIEPAAAARRVTLAYQNITTTETLPPEVAGWAGLESLEPNPEIPYDGNSVSLSHLNDTNGLTFKQIAKLIEKSL